MTKAATLDQAHVGRRRAIHSELPQRGRIRDPHWREARTTPETLAAARWARIQAERELTRAVERAELRYRETAEIGARFDRELGMVKRKRLKTRA